MSDVSTTRVLIDDNTGLPVGRLTIHEMLEPDAAPNAHLDPSDLVFPDESVATFRYREARLANTLDGWYNHNTDNEFIQAFIRTLDTSMTDEFAQRVFSRWMRAYHPTIPFEFITLQTGYSQGDWVDMLFVGNPDFWTWVESPIERSYKALAYMKKTIKVFGAFTRGDYHEVTYERPELTYDPLTGKVSISWFGDEDQTYFVLALNAFTITEENVAEAYQMAPWDTTGRTWVEGPRT